MRAWIDISVPLAGGITQWPGDPLFSGSKVTSLEDGAEANVTAIALCAHTGTHIDAPLHYFREGGAVDSLPFDALIGVAAITTIDRWHEVSSMKRVLLRTCSPGSSWWREPFRENHGCLTPDQALALTQAGVRLVGIDYLSIGGAETHRILLAAGVVILEGLDLSQAVDGEYDLICLPLRLEGADGAPGEGCRAAEVNRDGI